MVSRRTFATGLAAGTVAGAFATPAAARIAYRGPNVILVRFGGGVRRAETVERSGTYAPFLLNRFASRGVLIPDMRIEQLEGAATSHAEGTINILTGRYLAYADRGSSFLEDRLEPTHPTLFEYVREAFALEPHEALLINGEDRPQEEYLVAGATGHRSLTLRAEMLSLHRFKLHKFARILAERKLGEDELLRAQEEYDEVLSRAPPGERQEPSPTVASFWDRWREDFGDSGLVNPRGDALLTEIAIRAMRELRPRLMMINYQDTDYVHWGNPSHYTRAISIIDKGLEQIVATADADDFYRGNTVFVVVPDCGRDTNSLMDIPFQHHFNTRSAHEIWALIAGPGIVKGRVLDRTADQSAIAATIGAVMGFKAKQAEGTALSELLT
ncbi:MAG: hypothetical protein ACKVP5_17595 [Aestuariivirga sp.]